MICQVHSASVLCWRLRPSIFPEELVTLLDEGILVKDKAVVFFFLDDLAVDVIHFLN